jgi:hypothetical protein
MQEWISIQEAQEKIINWSSRKYYELIWAGKIAATEGGRGKRRMVNVASLKSYLETLSQPMGS